MQLLCIKPSLCSHLFVIRLAPCWDEYRLFLIIVQSKSVKAANGSPPPASGCCCHKHSDTLDRNIEFPHKIAKPLYAPPARINRPLSALFDRCQWLCAAGSSFPCGVPSRDIVYRNNDLRLYVFTPCNYQRRQGPFAHISAIGMPFVSMVITWSIL